MLRAIRYLEERLNELYKTELPRAYEQAQEHLYEIDDIQDALQILKQAEGVDD